MTYLNILDFDEIERQWWEDYLEELPTKAEDYEYVCPKCNGAGCHWCLLVDRNLIA